MPGVSRRPQTLAVALCVVGPAWTQEVAPPSKRADDAGRPASDSGTLEEVIVTAQRRSENLQKVPIAVTALSAADLQATGMVAGQLTTSSQWGYERDNSNPPRTYGATIEGSF
jgi:outer membrane receptor protein involved in Fe transport